MPTFGLQLSTIRSRVMDYGNIKNIEGASDKADIAINDAMRKLAGERRWYALRRQGTITPITDTQSYVLTGMSGFNYPVRVYYISNGIEQPIDIVNESEWADMNDNDSSGDPSICAFLEISGAMKLYLSPLPSSTFISQYTSIYIDYDKKPDELSSDTDVPEIPPTNCQMVLVYTAVAELLAKQGDSTGMQMWEAKAMKELNKYFTNDINFRGAKFQRGKPMFGIMGGSASGLKRDYR